LSDGALIGLDRSGIYSDIGTQTSSRPEAPSGA
jgi:hypothetical protein